MPFSAFLSYFGQTRLASLTLLVVIGMLATPSVVAQVDTTYRKINLNKTITIPANGELHIQLKTPARVEITATTGSQCKVELQMEGQYLVVDFKQLSQVMQLVSYYEKPGKEATKMGLVRIQLPAQTSVEVDLWDGNVSLKNLTASIKAHVQNGDIEAVNLSGTVSLYAPHGNVTCQGGTLGGSVACGKGTLTIDQVKGSFGIASAQADFQLTSPTQPVVATLSEALLKVQVKEGDLKGNVRGGKASVYWQGDKEIKGKRIQLSVINSELALYLPAGMGTDFSLLQLSSPENTATQTTTSDFGQMNKLADRTVMDQGKSKRMQKNTHSVAGGGNTVDIISNDSVIALKKG